MFFALLTVCCSEDDRQKVEYIYLHYGKTVFYVINQMIDDASAAEDLTQDVFVILLKMSDRLTLEDEGKLRSLVTILARNRAVDYIRRMETEEYAAYQNDIFDEVDEQTPYDSMQQDDTYQRLLDGLERLKDPYKAIFQLKYFHGYHDNRDIAKMLGISAREVSVKLWRGKRLLLQMMEDNQNDGQ